jgi:transposase
LPFYTTFLYLQAKGGFMSSSSSSALTSSNSLEVEVNRFVGFDISKRTSMVAAVDVKQQIVLKPRKVGVERLAQWASQNLLPTDKVVIEATFNAWYYYDILVPFVNSVVVANPNEVRLIAQSKVKTDGRDALALAKLLAAELVPTVWVPPLEVRELRLLVAQRHRLVKQRTQAKNRLQAIVMSHHILPPVGEPFSLKNREWWETLDVSASTKLMIAQELTQLQNLQPLITQAEDELIKLSNSITWSNQSVFLLQLPGIGVITAMVILSCIGQVKRFPTAKHLVGYSGLGASIHSSGQITRTGSITKEGRRELRTALVEAAWSAVEHDEFWKTLFERLSGRIGKGKAIVAVARKLLVVIWHVLSEGVADRQAKEERVTSKLLRWGYKLKTSGRKELSNPTFARMQLNWLGLGAKLSSLEWYGRHITLPSLPATDT